MIKIKNEWFSNALKIKEACDDPNIKYVIAVCARRFGKTELAVKILIERALKKKSKSWWISPVYSQAKIPIEYTFKLFSEYNIIRRYNKSILSIELINGSVLEFKSAENSQNLLGHSNVDFLYLDESGSLLNNQSIWYEVLRPLISSNPNTKTLFLGTPKGNNLFRTFYNYGQDPTKPEWASFRFSASEGFMVNFPEEIEEMKRTLPERIFRQEILAEFIDGEGALFRNIDSVCSFFPEEPKDGITYYCGIDLGRMSDATVVSMGYKNKCVLIEKIPSVNWKLQIEKIRILLKHFNHPHTLIDTTGAGQVVFEDMVASGIENLNPFNFTNKSKNDLINNLILGFEKQNIQVCKNELLIEQLKQFSFFLSPSGNIKMEASLGHDDFVISLALLFWNLKSGDYDEKNIILESFGERISTQRIYASDTMPSPFRNRYSRIR